MARSDWPKPTQANLDALEEHRRLFSGKTVPALRIKAEMARRALLSHQRVPWWSPDTERTVTPNTDPEVIAEAWSFLAWLEEQLG